MKVKTTKMIKTTKIKRKLVTCIVLMFSLGSIHQVHGQVLSHDVLSFSQLVSLSTTAVSQANTAMEMLETSKKSMEALKKVKGIIVEVGNVGHIIALASGTISMGKRILDGAFHPAITDTQTALNYTGKIIYGTQSIIRNIDRLDKMISDMLMDASDMERLEVFDRILKEIEEENEEFKEMEQNIQMQKESVALRVYALQRTGIKVTNAEAYYQGTSFENLTRR